MVDNPIKYSDLFASDVLTGIQSIKSALDDLMNFDKSKLGEIGKALRSVSPDTADGQQKIVEYSQQIEVLSKRIKDLEAQLKSLGSVQSRVKAASDADLRARIEQRQAVREQTQEIKALIAQEKIGEAELQRLSQVANLQKMSYNELSRTYAMLKDQVNAMTAETQAETVARQRYLDVSKQVYLQMITLQEATGKHTLSVGNYAKAFNGLNLATQQIVRELPTVTMGARMFFMAVSNNIPILTDQISMLRATNKEIMAQAEALRAQGAGIDAVKAKQAEAIPVGKALLQSLLSWQTLMLVGITILTQYGDKIWAWVKSLFQGRDALKAVREAQEDFNKTVEDAELAGEKARVEASVLYQIATQETRAMEDRTNAAIALQQQYPEYFEQLSTEQIMLGDAKDAYDSLTESLVRQAQARAYLDKITELTAKRIEVEEKVASARARQMQFMNEPDINAQLASANTPGGNPGASMDMLFRGNDDGRYQKAKKAAEEAQSELSAIDDEIQKIIDRIPVDGLLTTVVEGKGRGGKTESAIADIDAELENLKYIRKAEEEFLGNIMDDTERELALSRFKYENQLEDFRAFQAKQAEIQTQISELTTQRDQEVTLEKRNELTKQINDLRKKWKIDEEGQAAVNAYLHNLSIHFQAEQDAIRANAEKAEADARTKTLDEELELQKLIIGNTDKTEEEKKKAILLATIDTEEKRLEIMMQYENVYSATQIAIVRETIEKLKREWGMMETPQGSGESFIERMFGGSKTARKFFQDLRRILRLTAENIKEIIDLYAEQAKAAAEAAEKQVEAAEKVYDAELAAYQNGYANNVEFARKELDARRKQHQEALAEAKRYEQMQQAVDSAQQISSMVTAAANILASWSKLPGLGQAIAVAAIAAMFASFAAAKITAASMARNPVTYGDGMSEYLDYGGSHASGHDIDFGHTRDGRPRRVERGEMIAVFNKRNTDKYGAPMLAGLVDAINRGTLERELAASFSGADGEFSVNVTQYEGKYIRDISRDLKAIRQGEMRTVTPMPDGSILIRQGNHTRRIRK